MADFASVTYFHNSGFTVSVQDTLLVFDYWRGEHNEVPKNMELGKRDFADYSQILVFVTHDHVDHFDRAIYDWDDGKLPITYIISDDLPEDCKGRRVKPGKSLTVGDAEIRVFGSTDKGVSFWVLVGGIRVFHAGDLNFWHWREESTLREIAAAERAFYDAMAPVERLPIDIAMFPVDPRLGGLYEAGANYFVMSVKPRLFIPMHWQGRPEVAFNFARKGRTKYTEVLALTKPRERAELAFDDDQLDIQVFAADPADFGGTGEVHLNAYAPGDPFSDTDLPVKL